MVDEKYYHFRKYFTFNTLVFYLADFYVFHLIYCILIDYNNAFKGAYTKENLLKYLLLPLI